MPQPEGATGSVSNKSNECSVIASHLQVSERITLELADVDVATRVVAIGFEAAPSSQMWMKQIAWLKDAVHVLRQEARWVKLGRNTDARLKADVKSGVLLGYLKQVEVLNSNAETVRKSMEVDVGHDEKPPVDFTSIRALLISPEVLEGLTNLAQTFSENVKQSLGLLSDCTHDRHHGAELWKLKLQEATSVTENDITTCASLMLADINMDPLDGILAGLLEAGC